MHFTDIPQSGQIALTFSRLSIGYDDTPLLPPITQTVTLGQRIALVGPNGIGKTTLFKTLLGETQPLDGSFHFGAGVHPGYLSQEQEMLDPTITVLETIQTLPDMGNHSEARTFFAPLPVCWGRSLSAGGDLILWAAIPLDAGNAGGPTLQFPPAG